MKIVIKTRKKLGLEVFQCFVNGVYATEFLSIGGARTWADKALKRVDS